MRLPICWHLRQLAIGATGHSNIWPLRQLPGSVVSLLVAGALNLITCLCLPLSLVNSLIPHLSTWPSSLLQSSSPIIFSNNRYDTHFWIYCNFLLPLKLIGELVQHLWQESDGHLDEDHQRLWQQEHGRVDWTYIAEFSYCIEENTLSLPISIILFHRANIYVFLALYVFLVL